MSRDASPFTNLHSRTEILDPIMPVEHKFITRLILSSEYAAVLKQ